MRQQGHIVHILGTLGAGGAQRVVLDIAGSQALSHYKHSIICAFSRSGEFVDLAKDVGIEVHECPMRWPKNTSIPSYRVNKWLRDNLKFTFVNRLARLLKAINADLVHSHLTASIAMQAQATLNRAQIPWIWTLHGLYKSRGEDTSDWKSALRIVSSTKQSCITGVSQAALDEVRCFGIVPTGQLHLIYNGINRSGYQISQELRKRWRERLRIPQEAIVFGSAGRLIPLKRYDVAIEAFATIANEYSFTHFVIAGDGVLMDSLKQQVHTYDLDDRVHLLGYQDDMNAVLNLLDVFVLTSASEGLPLVLIEAVTLGIPCIATNVGGVPEILGNTGVLIAPDSVEQLQKAMRSHLVEGIQRMPHRAQELAKYDVSVMIEKYSQLYAELLTVRP